MRLGYSAVSYRTVIKIQSCGSYNCFIGPEICLSELRVRYYKVSQQDFWKNSTSWNKNNGFRIGARSKKKVEVWYGKFQILRDRKLKFFAQNTTNPFFRDEVDDYCKLKMSWLVWTFIGKLSSKIRNRSSERWIMNHDCAASCLEDHYTEFWPRKNINVDMSILLAWVYPYEVSIFPTWSFLS
jgi:hypothetical protein